MLVEDFGLKQGLQKVLLLEWLNEVKLANLSDLCHSLDAPERLIKDLIEVVRERLVEATADLTQLLEEKQEAAEVGL